MSDTTDGRFADVANYSCVNRDLYGSWGTHLMINDDSWCGGIRGSGTGGSGRGALLFVVGTKGPDHDFLKVTHEVNRGALNIGPRLGNITAVSG